MKKRAAIFFAVVAILITVVTLALYFTNRGERYKGKTAAGWSIAAYNNDAEAQAALRALSPGCMPELIRRTDYREPAWRARMRGIIAKSPAFIRSRYGPKFAVPDVHLNRVAAIRSLGLIGPDAAPAIPELSRILMKVPNEMRSESARALGRIGSASLPSLTTAIKDGDLPTQSAALSGLGEMGAAAAPAIPLMLPFLGHADGNTRLLAGYNLNRIGTEGLFAIIELQANDDPKKQEAATEFLRRQMSSVYPPVVALRDLSRTNQPVLRQRAVDALGKMRPATAFNVRLIIARLDDTEPPVRLAAIGALQRIGARAVIALPALQPLADDPDPVVRNAATNAIASIMAAAANEAPPQRQ